MLTESKQREAAPINGKQREDSLLYCMKIVKERDYDNYLAALLMPERVRPRIFSLLALNAEVSVIRQKIKRNSGVTGIYQLQFWKDALNIFSGEQRGPLPRQPVVLAMKAFGKRSDVPLLLKLVEARQGTLGDRPFATLQKLELNSELVYGSLMLLWMNALSESSTSEIVDEKVNEVIRNIARCVGTLTLLRATVPLLKEGLVLFPEDFVAKHNLTPDAIFNNTKPDSLRNLTKDLCQTSKSYLLSARANSSAKQIPKQMRPALMTCGQRSDNLLRVLERNKYNLFDSRLQSCHPLTSWKLLWRYCRNIY